MWMFVAARLLVTTTARRAASGDGRTIDAFRSPIRLRVPFADPAAGPVAGSSCGTSVVVQQQSRGAATGRITLVERYDQCQIAVRCRLSEGSKARLYENTTMTAETKEVRANTKELLAG